VLKIYSKPLAVRRILAKVSSKLTLSRLIESDAHGTQGAGMDRAMAETGPRDRESISCVQSKG